VIFVCFDERAEEVYQKYLF